MKRGNGIRIFLIVFFVVLIVFSGWKLHSVYSGYSKGAESYQNLADRYTMMQTEQMSGNENVAVSGHTTRIYVADSDKETEAESREAFSKECITVDFEALKAECEDVVGWLYCPGTKVNYPIVQSSDNDYYLHRLPNGEYNSGGALFLDYRNTKDFSDWNNIVYGHNMKDGSMFATLPKYMEQNFYEQFSVWYLLTEEQNYELEVVGGYVTPADSDTYVFPQNFEELQILFEKASKKSSFAAGKNLTMTEAERLITLSTCVYDYEDARYVLVGVLRKIAET